MNLNIENIVRSGVALVVFLPVTLGMANSLASSTRLSEEAASQKNEYQELVSEWKTKLLEPCLAFSLSKPDTKVEREAMNRIDDVIGGDALHRDVCRWAL